MKLQTKIPAVNFHLIKACNLKCRFCFATFRDVKGRIPSDHAARVISALRDAGAEKINFAGGEPTLHPQLGSLIRHSKNIGLTTSIVTNGFHLVRLLDECAGDLDWVGLSVDSGLEEVQQALGRGDGTHVASTIRHADLCRAAGVRVKVNTVVTKLSWGEDMTVLIRRLAPERWKVFQVLALEGQNDGSVEDLLITSAQFRHFVTSHEHLTKVGFPAVIEDNDDMCGSYVMIDPLGRFFGNSTGAHVYSPSILDVGVEEALKCVGFDIAKFQNRGGMYAW